MWLRWELAKIWKCRINDPIFDDITLPEWYMYSSLVIRDRKQDEENKIAMVEYLASFWNSEAVKKIREARESKSQHAFLDDEEFEKTLVSREFKNNPILDAVINMNKKSENDNQNHRGPKSKLPTDLSSIHRTMDKFKK